MEGRHFLRTGGSLYQRGRGGLGSVIKSIALPALRRLAPAVKSAVRKHGPSAVRSVARAGLKSLRQRRGQRKQTFAGEMARAVGRKLARSGGGKKKKRRRKKPAVGGRGRRV